MRLLPLMLLSLLACGPSGPGRFTGTVQSNSLEVKSALLVGNSEVWLSNTKDLCPKLMANQFPKAGTFVKIILYPVATGDFAVSTAAAASKDHTASAQFFKLGDTCSNTLAFASSIGTKGTVTVTRFDTNVSIEGSFDTTFGDTDAATGVFIAQYCNATTLYPSPECVDVQ